MNTLIQRVTKLSAALAATVAVAALCVAPAQAGTISIGTTAVTSPSHVANFDIGALGNSATNQFVSSGLTMTTLGGIGISLISQANCPNGASGVVGQYLYMGVSSPCSGNSSSDAVSIKFAGTVGELSWTGFSRATNGGFTISALLDGAVVSSTNFTSTNRFENKTVLFTGSDFDELRFVENGSNSQFFALDNMAWTDGAAVPEPAGLALFGLGLALVAAGRRRKT